MGSRTIPTTFYPGLPQISPLAKNSPAAAATPTATGSSGSTSGTIAQYGQCGGIGFTGATACVSPFTCHVVNPCEYHIVSNIARRY